MITNTFYVDPEDAKTSSDRLRLEWCFSILEMIGIDLSPFVDDDVMNRTIEQKAALREMLSQEKILFRDNFDGSLDIYVHGNLIAQWEKPYFRRHVDPSEINPARRNYVSIETKYWSVFDEEMEIENDRES